MKKQFINMVIVCLVLGVTAVSEAACMADFEGSAVDVVSGEGNLTSAANLDAGTTAGSWSDLAQTNGNVIVSDTMVQFGLPNHYLFIGNNHTNDTAHVSTATLNLDSPTAIGAAVLSMTAVMEGAGGQAGGMYIEGYSTTGEKLFKIAFGNGESADSPALRGEMAHYDAADAKTDLGGDVWIAGDWVAGQGTRADITLTLGASDFQIDADNGTSTFMFPGLSYINAAGGDLAKVTFTAVQNKASWALDNIEIREVRRKVQVSPAILEVLEGQSISYEVGLEWLSGNAPTQDVSVTVIPTSHSQYISINGTPAGQAVVLNFTAAAGYDTPQTVTLSAIDDQVDTGLLKTVVLEQFCSSADASWEGITGANVSCRISDDEGVPGDLVLWYDEPATDWMREALPLGNGRLGAMVFGGVPQERIQFNEDSLWTGTENLSGGYSCWTCDDTSGFGYIENFGDIYIDFEGQNTYSNYRRQLDLGNATIGVRYESNGVSYSRQSFCSPDAQVIVVRLTADQPGSYTGRISLNDGHAAVTTVSGNKMTASGKLDHPLVNDDGLLYESQLVVLNEGGELSIVDNQIYFDGVDGITLLLAADTEYIDDYSLLWKGEHPSARLAGQLAAASAQHYETLLAEHIDSYQQLFGRVTLDLGANPAMNANTTDVRLANYKAGTTDHGLEELFFQYGRYLLLSSSRPGHGALPTNLLGLWTDVNNPRWHGDYHTNINVQMNYWLAEVTNLGECHDVLLDYVIAQTPVWRLRTDETYGIRGWAVRTSTNIVGGMGWNWNNPGNAWYAMHFWERYAFNGDLNYLSNKAYPVLKECCQFWQDRLITDPDTGLLVAPNEWSPEQGGWEDGVTYAQQLIYDLFTNYIKASQILDIDSAFRADVIAMRSQLFGPQIGSWGQIQEWMTDKDSPTNTHRHLSHLIACYPGSQITPKATPAWADAVEVTLNARGDGSTGWSRAWRAALWARLLDGDRACSVLKGLLSSNIGDNLFNIYPPFQIDGNLGYTAALAEVLIQSHEDEVALLPALPSDWPDGSVTGLCARGGLEVDMKWVDGQLTLAAIRPKKEGVYRLRYGDVTVILETDARDIYYWNGQWITDINLDGKINLGDFAAIAERWLSVDCNEESNWCMGKDVDRSGKVDIEDLAYVFGELFSELEIK